MALLSRTGLGPEDCGVRRKKGGFEEKRSGLREDFRVKLDESS